MTQPTANWNLVRVTGTYTTLKSETVAGTIDFAYKTITKDHNAKKVVFADVFTATVTAGVFTIVLPASDDPDIDGTPFTVTVSEHLTANGSSVGRPSFDVEVSLSNPVSGSPAYPTVDISDLGKVTVAPLVASYVTRPEMNAAIAAGGGGGGGGVTSVDARTGVVVLSDRYDAINAASSAISAHNAASDPHGDRANAATLYIPLTQKAANSGVASLDSGGKVPSGQIPSGLPYDASGAASTAQAAAIAAAATDATTKANGAVTTAASAAAGLYVPLSQRGAASGVATLDGSTKVPTAQIPALPYDASGAAATAVTTAATAAAGLYIPLSQRAANNGVATLGSTGLVPPAQIGSAPVLVLNIGDPVPGGTPAGTVIVRH